jgi:hypothetical protein
MEGRDEDFLPYGRWVRGSLRISPVYGDRRGSISGVTFFVSLPGRVQQREGGDSEPKGYLAQLADDVLGEVSGDDEFDWQPPPPKAAFTLRMRAKFEGKGKPLPYPDED